MEPIKFISCTKEYYFKKHLIFVISLEAELKHDNAWFENLYLKTLHKYYEMECEQLSDKELLDELIIKKLSKPTTFPKFNNEIPFKIRFNGKTIKTPTITAIRWNGKNWEYQIKNIGHLSDFHSETLLEKL